MKTITLPTAIWLYMLSIGHSQDAASELIQGAGPHIVAPDQILVHRLDLTHIVGRHAAT